MQRTAKFSKCQQYRYRLTRTWNPKKPTACFIGLNPSTADAENDDPTIRRCIAFADHWGFGGITVVNLFAYRATIPKAMFDAAKQNVNIVGPRNKGHLEKSIREAKVAIAAWGTPGDCCTATELLNNYKMHHLGLNKNGTPKHPLYLNKNTKLLPFRK